MTGVRYESRVPGRTHPWDSDSIPGDIGHQLRPCRGYLLDGTLVLREAENHFSYQLQDALCRAFQPRNYELPLWPRRRGREKNTPVQTG
jgi:hypothetical protein